MKVRAWTSVLALGAALLGAPVMAQSAAQAPAHEPPQAWAEHGHMGVAAPHGARMEKMAEKLGLSAEQKKQLQALHEQEKAGMQAQREQRQKLQAERSAAWAAPTLDAARLENLRVQEVKMFDAMSRQRLEQQLAMAKILTPEQRQKMAEWKKQRKAKPARGHHGHD